jgi:hypothetical protein
MRVQWISIYYCWGQRGVRIGSSGEAKVNLAGFTRIDLVN